MQSVFFRSTLLAGLGAACLFAQAPASPGGESAVRQQSLREHLAADEAAMLGMRDLRVAAELNLTADQQSKIRTAFDEAAAFRKGVADQCRGLRIQLAAAVEAGDQAMIDQLSEALGTILQQQIAFQAKTVAKVYGALTPEQKLKLDEEVKTSLGARGQEPRKGL